MMSPEKFQVDIIDNIRMIEAFQGTIAEWYTRMRAVQSLRQKYEKSSMAQIHFKEREKLFKKKYWEAYGHYTTFRKEFLGE